VIELRLNKAVEALRRDFLGWIASNPPPKLPERHSLDDFAAASREWQRKLADARWIGVHWPEKFGGRGLSIVEEAVLQGELARAGSPQLIGLFGITMVGPVLIRHGTDAQKNEFLRRILSSEDIWCQGFSEPEAGSDLAAVKTQARLDSGRWTISGQKIWTSFAQYARWCFLLARSDMTAPKHRGLSYLLVKMDSPGITTRPLKQITGEEEFNEIFFDNVETPETSIVGKPGEGWDIAISTLMFERVVLTFARHLQSEVALAEIRSLMKKRQARESERQKLGSLIAANMAVRALALSHLVTYDDSHHPGPEGSYDKLGWSETFQQICRFGLDLLGPDAVITGGPVQHRYLYSRGRTIAAGTSEIQRNIIADRILRLPR
jgi:alkylation response protein AidB-like acyl-CoA dehydrogenase